MSETDIQVRTEETSSILRTLEIEVSEKRVRKTFDKAYRDLAKSVRVKGFRPGKAPRSVLEKMYGPSLGEDLERQLVNETLGEAIDQAGVIPVSEPAVEADPPIAGASYTYKVAIEVKPEITLGELGGLPATRPVVLVDDDDIEGELNQLRERRSGLEDEPEDAVAETGTTLTVDYEGRIDGELFEGGASEGATIELGAGRLVPGFEEQLEGAKVGDDRTVNVTFPEDYPAEELAGKEASFAVKVHKLQRRQTPELDDAFVVSLNEEGIETVDALKDKVRDDVQQRKQRAADDEARTSLMDALIERTPFDVPPGLVDRQLEGRLQQAHQQLGQFMPPEELNQRLGQWRAEWRPQAERDVRENLLLDAVAAEKGFEASDEDVDAKLEEMARDQGMALDRLRQMYEERGLVEGMKAQLRSDQALEFLLSEAKVEETTGT